MYKHIISVFVLAGMLSSCLESKDELVPSTGAKVDLTLSISSVSPATKTVIEEHTGDDGKTAFSIKWAKGDKLGVLLDSWGSKQEPALVMDNTSASTESASFQGIIRDILDGSHFLYTFSPASALLGTEGENKINLAIPTEQHLPNNSFDPTADLVAGKSYHIVVKANNPFAEISNIRFSRILATIIVRVVNNGKKNLEGEKIRKITLTSNMADAALTGSIQWDYASESISVLSANNSVTAILESPISIDGESSAFILVNPITLSKGSSLVVTMETDKHRITKTISSLPQDLVFPGNNVSALKLTITDADTMIEEL
ncbi:MAG: fimbrillin family protein [Bacteroidales bacterium]|nr:fimbrillin family protein [Bacteroidales bacterium]